MGLAVHVDEGVAYSYEVEVEALEVDEEHGLDLNQSVSGVLNCVHRDLRWYLFGSS